MGLGQARRRVKISHDPNNTAWSRSSTAYGQKILQSHGWTPGSVLGASDSTQSVPSSAANIPKIVLKDDNLGLGARGGANGNGQCTGLDVFQGILGRLNGHNEPHLEGHEKLSEDRVKTGTHQESCTKAVRFLSGGFLGETKQQPIMEEEIMKPTGSLSKSDDCVQQVQTQLKCDDMIPNHTELSNPTEKKASRNRRLRSDKQGHHKKESTTADSKPLDLHIAARREDKVEQKSKRRIERDAEKAVLTKNQKKALVDVPADFHQDNQSSKKSTLADSEPLDLHIAARREDKVEQKSKRRIERDAEKAVLTKKQKKALVDVPAEIRQDNQSSQTSAITGLGSISQSSRPLVGRHAVRQRYIRQMKMATMDSKALNEILMVKG